MATRGWEGAIAEQRAMSTPRRKYRNTTVEINGLRFDSRAEADVWLKLRDREARGEIQALRRQVPFDLKCPIEQCDGLASPRPMSAFVCRYIADFVYLEAGVEHVIDVKRPATKTALYRLKKRWLDLQLDIEIEEVPG